VGKPTKQEAAAVRAHLEATASAVLVTTGDVQAKYQPVNIVFAIATLPQPQRAFEATRQQLQMAAVSLGGNAVVFCRFGYEAVASQNFGCTTTSFVVSGYGTVVKFV